MPSDNNLALRLVEALRELDPPECGIMEVCGTHTHAIAKAGIRQLLPEGVELLSGPGCPVCVTPAAVMDSILDLAMEPSVVIATYGDLVRVPGSAPGDSLQRRRAKGARVEIVYSPVDAVELAKRNPDKEVVFLGAGFETTAPGTAASVLTAQAENVRNFSLFSMLKTVEPALRALIATEDFSVSGFLCPGHVAVITGERGFEFLPRDCGIPGVISGFEPEDILASIYSLLSLIKNGEARLTNEYKRVVSPCGNRAALGIMERCFEPRRDLWRGLGAIDGSGLRLKPELSAFDAELRFGIEIPEAEKPTACRCGDVICGRIRPEQCPLFGRRCLPEDPVGPCMVSSEGACSAAYKYAGV